MTPCPETLSIPQPLDRVRCLWRINTPIECRNQRRLDRLESAFCTLEYCNGPPAPRANWRAFWRLSTRYPAGSRCMPGPLPIPRRSADTNHRTPRPHQYMNVGRRHGEEFPTKHHEGYKSYRHLIEVSKDELENIALEIRPHGRH